MNLATEPAADLGHHLFAKGRPMDLLALGITACAASRLSMFSTVMVGMGAAAMLRAWGG